MAIAARRGENFGRGAIVGISARCGQFQSGSLRRQASTINTPSEEKQLWTAEVGQIADAKALTQRITGGCDRQSYMSLTFALFKAAACSFIKRGHATIEQKQRICLRFIWARTRS